MFFPVSGVEINPLIPPLVAFIVSSITASAGVSGAFLLLPFQVSVLHYTSPSVSPTNLIYNIVAIPGGLYRFIKEGRMAWPLTWVVSIGTLPGVFLGSWVRIEYLPDPRSFKLFMGGVLLYLGIKIITEFTGGSKKQKAQNKALEQKFKERVAKIKAESNQKIAAGLPADAVVKTKSFSMTKIEYEFWGETYSFSTVTIFTLALAVGLIGGIYGIGGGAIIAPFCVSILGLPVYTVAGAALAGTFLTSIAGVIFYSILAMTAVGASANVAPDWALGALFGVGGLLGTYCGAYIQKYLKENIVKVIMAALILFLALQYIVQFFL
ncbi:sulfite exporter TauE/SafE family protein [Desulfoscipio gibsoniae]|uniref:Probable membrane transporter protein n=1 Tax=Desulfoscipio gibsoniae DSM 7213 TaxID=767817 RepID=R4KHV4_9FIRM|nr:sulfite exporter TauE/SafE family protein [Desulfoscipio gibsoniae]AGL02194.1 putative permease [Desulfoscipio gibsoniae DSM 7213]